MSSKDDISSRRKLAYTLGLVLVIVGFLSFFVFFIYGALAMAGVVRFDPPVGVLLAPPVGMLMIIAGFALRIVVARGTAGGGLVLDPQKAREDLKPWSRMGGGMLKDALEAAGISAGGKGDPDAPSTPLPFDEQLRRLHRLHEEGLISAQEYEAKRKEILARM